MTTMGQVQQYAACIFEPGDSVEVRAIASGGRVRKFWRKAQDLPGLVPELERLNAQGYNIYVGPNPRKGDGLSGDENVLLCRTLFVDFDKVEPGDGCGIWEFVEPRIEAAGLVLSDLTVFSGHGIHAYWRLTEAIAPDRWRIVQERLIATLGADPACKNPERLMRLPGFLNCKSKPFVDCFTMFASEVN